MRPRKKPLQEFYNDDDAELEALAEQADPAAPRPEGAVINPARGEAIQVADDRPRSLDAALQKWGTAPSTAKLPIATVLDQSGRPASQLIYCWLNGLLSAKLLSRSCKVAYLLLHKLHCTQLNPQTHKNEQRPLVKSGDRVALIYPNNDPLNFMVAFYGCLMAGVIPVAIEVPVSKRDAGLQQLGFLLGSCATRVALTSDACLKGLPKTQNGDVEDFRGWPKLTWVVTEHMPKPPKDWKVPARLTDDTVAYVEYCADKEGSVKGACVTRTAMISHCRALSAACAYRENEVVVCVLDFKREMGLWHAVLASVLNGMQVIFIPYALMKINPSSWMHMVTRFKAGVALVKSRDLHWGLLATKDQKDINLASLRVLLVADGANPC